MIVSRILGFAAFLLLSGQAWSEYNLTIVHISDFHSHWFEFNDLERKCTDEESRAGRCFGGFPRLLNLVRDIRQKEKNVVVLSSGEFFLGRSLNPLHGWKVAGSLLPKLDLDAMSLSNHDFSNGIFELSAFLYGMKFPVLCANMWARETSYLYSRINKSAALDINGERIGIVGYLHPETLEKSKKAVSVKFSPEIPAIKEEVKRLESFGFNKIIALGHSGYYTDLDIAKNVKGVDVVIGGNSDIVLEEPYDDDAEVRTEGNIHGNYPRVHHHKDSNTTEAELKNRTLVLHIPQHGKYVGVIKVTFDEHGRVIHEEGKPVLLDRSIPQDIETLNYLKSAHSTMEEAARNIRLPDDSEVLAKAEFKFESRKCRMQECSLGNLVTDAMLQVYWDNEHIRKAPRDPEKWSHVDAVVFNAGSIRYPLPAGNITIKDLVHSLFVGDFMSTVIMNGVQMVEMMEHSVEKYDPTAVTAPGTFLQISGLRVLYDLSDSPGNRVKRLLVRCKSCANGNEEVDPNKTYFVAMPEFIAKGGDGYPRFQTADPDDFGQPEILLVVEYLKKVKFITPLLDGRISFLNESPQKYEVSTKSKAPTIMSTTSSKKADSKLVLTPSHGSKIEIEPTSTTATSESEQKTFKSTANPIIEKDTSTSQSQLSKLVNINSEMPISGKDHMNSTLVVETTTPDIHKFNVTTLVTPQSTTKSITTKSNDPKVYQREKQKGYPHISLLAGRDSENPKTHTIKEVSENNDKSVSEDNLSGEKLAGTTPETKPGSENVNKSEVVLSLKNGEESDDTNFYSPDVTKTEDNENNFVENHDSSPSTEETVDPAIHVMEENLSTEKLFFENDAINLPNESLRMHRGPSNKTKVIYEYEPPDPSANFIISENVVYDVVLKEKYPESTTRSQEISSAEVNSSKGEIRAPKGNSQLDEIKRQYSSFVQNSSISDVEKVLIEAALAEVNENTVMIGEGDLDRIADELKTLMNDSLQNKITVTTKGPADDELVTSIRDYFKEISLNFTQSDSIKVTDSETNPANGIRLTESPTKNPTLASIDTNIVKQIKNNRIVNGTDTNVTNHSSLKNFAQNSDMHKEHEEEIKKMLVNSVLNSVLDKVKTKIGNGPTDVNSPDSNKKSESILKKRSVVKKQLKLSAEEISPSSESGVGGDSTMLTSTYDSKTKTGGPLETLTESKSKTPKMIADVESQENSTGQASSQNQTGEGSHDTFYWLPWKIFGF